jgi:anti-sigma factor RsiW
MKTADNASTPDDLRGFHDDLAACAATQDEAEAVARLDGLLREGFRRLDAGTAPPAEERVRRIVEELRCKPHFATARRFRRSLRTLLWVTVLLLSVVGVYVFTVLVLEVLNR